MARSLQITDGKGFSLSFRNGYTVSVQFGPCNYCENRGKGSVPENSLPDGIYGSNNAEISVWRDALGKDDVLRLVRGWAEADQVAEVIGYVAA